MNMAVDESGCEKAPSPVDFGRRFILFSLILSKCEDSPVGDRHPGSWNWFGTLGRNDGDVVDQKIGVQRRGIAATTKRGQGSRCEEPCE